MMIVDVDTVVNLIGILAVVIIVLARLKPGLDDYFRRGTPILKEIDDIIDAVLLIFPDNEALKTIDDILEIVLKELEEAGYKLNSEEKKKVEYRLKARLKRAGIKVKYIPESGDYQLTVDS